MTDTQLVYIVDDDKGVRDSLQWLLESVNVQSRCFSSADNFLNNYCTHQAGCLVLDIRMPGTSGLDLQNILHINKSLLPIIFVTAHADVPIAIQAMKQGAFDFIEKPYSDQLLLERIQDALQWEHTNRKGYLSQQNINEKLQALTVREQQVLNFILLGKQNKETAGALSLSIKTIEAHRANLMRKLGANNTAELFHMAVAAGLL